MMCMEMCFLAMVYDHDRMLYVCFNPKLTPSLARCSLYVMWAGEREPRASHLTLPPRRMYMECTGGQNHLYHEICFCVFAQLILLNVYKLEVHMMWLYCILCHFDR